MQSSLQPIFSPAAHLLASPRSSVKGREPRASIQIGLFVVSGVVLGAHKSDFLIKAIRMGQTKSSLICHRLRAHT